MSIKSGLALAQPTALRAILDQLADLDSPADPPENADYADYADGVRDLLTVLGLLETKQFIAAPIDPTAAWLIRSLAAHVADQKAFQRWYDDALLTALESARAEYSESPTPLREVVAANVLIKATIDGQPCFLMQYDSEAHQFQLIGGKHEPHDTDLAYTALREMREELDNPTIVIPADLILQPLDQTFVNVGVSATFGVVSSYDIAFFHAQDMHFRPATDSLTMWVALDAMRTGALPDGRRLSTLAVEVFGDGLADLPDSLAPIDQDVPHGGLK